MKKCLRAVAHRSDQGKHRYLRGLLIAVFAFFIAASGIFMVSQPVEAAAPKLNKKNLTIKEGSTTVLTVKNAPSKVKWSVSNSKVVKITKRSGAKSAKVTLKGLKAGKATITVKIGKKRLTAVITVKHVHRWRGYATCTSKDYCRTCGVTRGSTIPHDWERETCQRPETCSKCGKTRHKKSGHIYGANNLCTMCGQRNLYVYMSIYIPSDSIGSGNLIWFHMDTKTDMYTRVFERDAQGYGTATAYDANNRKLKRLIAWNNNAAAGSLSLADGAGLYRVQMCSSDYGTFRFPADGYIEFDMWFGNEHYRIKVKCSRSSSSNYTYTLIK